MSILSKLFGGGGSPKTPDVEPIVHEGYTITPTPIAEGSRFRLSAKIEKEIEGELKTHTLIRADLLDSRDSANEVAITKAKQIIKEQGDRLFT